MSRSGYSDDCDGAELGLWRGAVRSAINGKRGQALLRDLIDALDAMPARELISEALECADGVCALGAVGRFRGLSIDHLNPEDSFGVAKTFDIAQALAREVVYINDEAEWNKETPAERWARVRAWAVRKLNSIEPTTAVVA